MSTSERARVWAATVAVSACACSFFDDDDAGLDDESETSASMSETESGGDPDWPPTEGFRVLPQYMLQSITAAVSIEISGQVFPCLSDTEDQGYLCDTSEALGPTVAITVERDGFETAIRNPELGAGIEPLPVHLTIEGGPEGAWSPCVSAGSFASCEEVCADAMLACVPAACATEDPEQPLATALTFTDAECLEPAAETLVFDCIEPLAGAGGTVASLQCCCAP